MKTLKSISLSILLFAVVAIASAKEVNTRLISSTNDLRNSLREKIVSDFNDATGFLYQNDVYKMNENVEVIFLITPEQNVKVIQVNCNNQLASDYIKQLLNKEPVNVTKDMIGMTYRVDIKLIYKAN